MAAATPWSDEFADQVAELLQDVVGSGAAPSLPVFATMAQHRGIALIDASRTTLLIDTRVYEGACFRLQRERRIRPPHRTIDATIWRGLNP